VTKGISTTEEGLLGNGLDSIRHAMDHFSERNREEGKSRHDDKWIVLSVHHAAECVCNALLLKVEPNCKLFRLGSSEWYPSLTKSLARLQIDSNVQKLTASEMQLLALLNQLPDIRHKFMHRIAPEEVDVSIAAMCLIGLLKHLEARYEIESSDIARQSPPIETDIVASIRYQRLEEYGKFIESFLQEKYEGSWLHQCPSCAARSVLYSRCEACFEELDSITCPECDAEILFLSWERKLGTATTVCQDCGKEIEIS
jgi:predicted RNA-binding Zn-ribbon protein involved in translation (DUF1610 family)